MISNSFPAKTDTQAEAQAEAHVSPTVAEVLSFAELQVGDQTAYASKKALSALVNWVHILTAPSAISLLDGGELILTTGAGWPQHGKELTKLAKDLIGAKVCAIVLELGQNFQKTPTELIEVCEEHDVALVSLSNEVRFVQITQRVHKRILAAQNLVLEARDEVHQMFGQLGLNRSPVDYMIEQMAATLGAPVVLENIAGEVISWAAPSTNITATEILAEWGSAQRANTSQFNTSSTSNTSYTSKEPKEKVWVEAQGKRWGSLTALSGPDHPAGRRTVLELGAFALALRRLTDPTGDEWLRQSSKRLIDTLLSGRYRHDTDIETQLEAAGLPIADRDLMAITLTSSDNFGSHYSLERAVLETALRRTVAPAGKIIIAETETLPAASEVSGSSVSAITFNSSAVSASGFSLIAIVSLPGRDPLSETHHTTPAFAKALARELEMLVPKTTPASWRAHLAMGVVGHGVSGMLASIKGVQEVGTIPALANVDRVSVQLAAKQPLAYLLRSFTGSPVLQSYVSEQIGTLIEYDKKSGPGYTGDLVTVLEAYLEHPTNKTRAAEKARLSRSVFYGRLELISDLLAADLNDGQTIAALSVAVIAYKI